MALLPVHRTHHEGVTVLPLRGPRLDLRAHAVVRRGRDRWPPLRVVLDRLAG